MKEKESPKQKKFRTENYTLKAIENTPSKRTKERRALPTDPRRGKTPSKKTKKAIINNMVEIAKDMAEIVTEIAAEPNTPNQQLHGVLRAHSSRKRIFSMSVVERRNHLLLLLLFYLVVSYLTQIMQ